MQHQQKYDIEKDMRYLQLLSQTFPNIAAAATEIINLSAILNLPKGTEHFIADIHGENEAFLHVIKNASGNIKRKVYELFDNTLREAELKELCTPISSIRSLLLLKNSAPSSIIQNRNLRLSRQERRISMTGTTSSYINW